MIRQFSSWQGVLAAPGRNWRTGPLVAVAVAAVMAGCATVGGGLAKDSPPAVKEAAVAERAKARWAAMIKRDYDGAYAFFSPSSRQATTLANFQTRVANIQYRAVSIDKVECVAEVCNVKLKLTYDYPPAKTTGVVTLLDESWVIDQGQAWFVFRG